MALKGKKKSRSRGSQARRRPGAAPRPTLGAARRPPWSRTTTGRIAAGVVGLAVLGVIVWAVTSSRADAERLADRQRAVNNYTSDVRGLLQTLIPPASEIGTAASIPPAQLVQRAKTWDKAFTQAQSEMSTAVAPKGLEAVNRLVLQSILLYVSAGDTYELAVEVEGGPKRRLQTQANVQWTSANSVFDAAIAILDDERAEADLSASTLQSPGTAPPSGPAQGNTSTTIDTSDPGGGDGSKKDGGKRKGRRSGKGGKNGGGKGDG